MFNFGENKSGGINMNVIKKFVWMFALLCVLWGCSSTNTQEQSAPLPDVMNKIYEGMEMPSMQQTPVTSENAVYYLGVDNLEYEEALASEPMIGSIAHSVVLVKMEEGADIEKAKETIKNNVDPRKWICVGVEKENILVENKGNLIILIMDNEVPQELLKNFLAM